MNRTTRTRSSQDVNLFGHTPNMADIDTRTVVDWPLSSPRSRTSTPRAVCLIGDKLVDRVLRRNQPDRARPIRAANAEFTVVGVFEKIGSVLGQDHDNFVVIPLPPSSASAARATA